MIKKKYPQSRMLLFFIIILGFILRIINLSKESLWIDELIGSILIAKQQISYLLNFTVQSPVDMYHIILHYWIQIFGESEFAVRFPALIFGVLSIFYIYKLGKTLFNKEIGLLSALILALSPFHIHYSQEARPYSLILLLGLISTYYYINFLKTFNKKDVISYIFTILIGIYAHYSIFFLLIFQNIYFLIYYFKNKKVLKTWFISQSILILIFLLYNPFFIKHIMFGLNGGYTYIYKYFSLFTIIKTFYLFILGHSFVDSNYCVPCFYVNPFIIFLVGIIFLFLLFYCIKKSILHKKNMKEFLYVNRKLVFLILFLLTPILSIFTISFIIPLFQAQYVISSSIPLYILVGVGLSKLKKNLKLTLVALLVFLFSFVLFGYYNDITKEQWREASDFINKYSKESDVIIYAYPTFVFEYYNVKIDKRILIPDNYPYPEESPEIFGEPLKPRDIDKITSNYDRVWLVLPPSIRLKDYEKVTKEFETLILKKEFKGVEIYLFEISFNK